ncbi:HAD family hydrolase [Haloarchaeobius iranensis]|uniref:Putative hydrolase of the HAD superfamily n=1 Tax=Haloarchaeobius iranensis TaxID=996166 RepID=A0A1H0B5Y7_9EURY|nr:HAD family hydrolase [Haloarchaeobius iranensis]SDN41148.1 putative hydrolase of the HAD superfamily [Haloarchaeobius iranensis]
MVATGPELVTLDLDDTLCRYDRSTADLLAVAFERADVEPFFSAAEYVATIPTVTGESPLDLRRKCFRALAAEQGRSVAVADRLAEGYPERDPTAVSFLPGAREALDALLAQHRLALVSNGEPSHQRAKLDTLGIAGMFEATVFGTPETGVKPDPEPFHRVLEAFGVGPGRAVHVGNSLASDVAGAQAAGIPAVWLRADGSAGGEVSPEYVVDNLAELHGRPFPWE